jgi:hypothetical protein
MNEAWAKRWVKALRSNRYKQGAGSLKTRDGRYCCLGVLCKVARVKFDPVDSYIPYGVAEKLGMKSITGLLPSSSGLRGSFDLATANDRGVSFAEIADCIETCWKDL